MKKTKAEDSIITISVKGSGSECCQGMITQESYEIFKNKYNNSHEIDNGWITFLNSELDLSGYYELIDVLNVVGVTCDAQISIMSTEDNFPFEYVGEYSEEIGPLGGDSEKDSSYIGFADCVTRDYGKWISDTEYQNVQKLENEKLATFKTSEFFEASIEISVDRGSFELGKLNFMTVSTDSTGYGTDYGDFIVGVIYDNEKYYFDYPSGVGSPDSIDFE